MKRLAMSLAALAALTLAGAAGAAGPHSASKSSGGSSGGRTYGGSGWHPSTYHFNGNPSFYRTNSFHGTSFFGKYHDHWGHCWWNSRYGCYFYWYPRASCYYYWCEPAGCYYPMSYCPYGTYSFGTPANYAPPSVPVVTAPVTATATATATAAAGVGPGPVGR
jgi:hypothetical protein